MGRNCPLVHATNSPREQLVNTSTLAPAMSADASKLLGQLPAAPAAGAAPGAIIGAIRKAAQTTGASFDYLLAAAKVESNLNPQSSARSSSATGLFQFIEQTWLGTMRQA